MESGSITVETATTPVPQDNVDTEQAPTRPGDADVASTAPEDKMDTNDSLPKKRPRIDMNAEPRKRGRSVFGMVLGTLKKAKDEDKARASTETAKRRAEVEERLARELNRRKDQVRMESESKKQRTKANQREEDLALKDSMVGITPFATQQQFNNPLRSRQIRQRQTTLPALANFLLTTDHIPSDFTFDPSAPAVPESGDIDTNMPDNKENAQSAPLTGKQLSQFLPLPPRSRNAPSGPGARTDGPPVYFLPAVLLPNQKAFLEKRQMETKRLLAAEEEAWKAERAKGLEEIQALRQSAQEAQQAARKAEDDVSKTEVLSPSRTKTEADVAMDAGEGEL
ncbi:hypothetical protein FRC06_011916 [Ceratobasidium sp. 370]|nr:hypothetical protein FRC06_011916 [Ceratobasidium sp. 370]